MRHKNHKTKILNRILELALTVLIVSLLSFILMRLSPVDPATAYAKRSIGSPTAEQIQSIRVRLGFDKPLYEQYLLWLKNLMHFDLGKSLSNGKPVWDNIALALPKTLLIVFQSAVMQMLLISLIGCIAFMMNKRFMRHLINLICLIGISMPIFYTGIILLDLFAVKWDIVSVSGNTTFVSYLLPAASMCVFGASFYIPLFIERLNKERNEDYVSFLRGNGLNERKLFFKHIFPNAAIRLIPSFFQSIGLMIANATIIEIIFSIPGFGYLIVNAVLNRDAPMIHAIVFFLALFIAIANIVADIINNFLSKEREV
ncbi:MAG: ABC transporter permease [Eubacteriales bacterium]|nr:ABC transporter permease [Eubacteriales bacterium]